MNKGTKIDLNRLRDLVCENISEYDSIIKEKDDEYLFGLIIMQIGDSIDAKINKKYANIEHFNEMKNEHNYCELYESCIDNSFENKVADVFISLLEFAKLREIELDSSVQSQALIDQFTDRESNLVEEMDFVEFAFDLTRGLCSDDDYDEKLNVLLLSIMLYTTVHNIDIFQYIDWKIQYIKAVK